MNAKNKNQSMWKKIMLFSLAVLLSLGGLWYAIEGKLWVKGIQAYIYSFPLMVMDVTREVSTAVPSVGEFKAPTNQFSVMSKYPDASFRLIPRTGLDTQFGCAWADLDEEPLVLSLPNTNGRYYVIALFDMWSNVFASIGSRTTGNDSVSLLLVGPNWKGALPDSLEVYKSPTRYVWVNGQVESNGASDYEVVNALLRQFKITPLSMSGSAYSAPLEVPIDPKVDTKTSITEQIKHMDAPTYFSKFAKLMKDNAPKAEDAEMIAILKSLGIEPGKDFDFEQQSSGTKRALNFAMKGFRLLEVGVKKLTTKEGWIVMPTNMANYGVDYMTRAGIALIGLGAVLPEDVSYPTAFSDVNEDQLDAANNYVIHFEKDMIPPAKVTWSVSMYDTDGFYVPNTLNRYHLAKWMPMKYNKDGSLDIYIQAESPGDEKESNWLPTPQRGDFSMTTRVFWPEQSALNGTWSMPGISLVN